MTCLGSGYEEWSGSDWCNLHASSNEYVLIQCITLFMALSFPLLLLPAWRWFKIRAFVRLLGDIYWSTQANSFLSNFSRLPAQAFTSPFLICHCQLCVAVLWATGRCDTTWLEPQAQTQWWDCPKPTAQPKPHKHPAWWYLMTAAEHAGAAVPQSQAGTFLTKPVAMVK